MLIILLSLAGGFVLLAVGGEALVRGSAALGLRFGLRPVLVGLTIVAFGTSAPELAVSLQAAAAGVDELAVGNVVGSNIANVGLILGLSALLRPAPVSSKLVRHDVPVMIVAALAMVVMLLDGRISRLEGAVLVAGIVGYLAFSVRHASEERRRVQSEFRQELSEGSPGIAFSGAATLSGCAALIGGGKLFVVGATGAAEAFGVPPAVVGLTIVALGTSLPEVATSIVAALRGHPDIATGNVVGSNIFNVLAILGITAVAKPLVRGSVTLADLGVMLAFSALPLPLMLSRGRLERWEGALLLACYVLYLLWLVFSTA